MRLLECSRITGVFARTTCRSKTNGHLFQFIKSNHDESFRPNYFRPACILLEDFAEKHSTILDELGVDYKLGLNDLEARIATLCGTTRRELGANLIVALKNHRSIWSILKKV